MTLCKRIQPEGPMWGTKNGLQRISINKVTHKMAGN